MAGDRFGIRPHAFLDGKASVLPADELGECGVAAKLADFGMHDLSAREEDASRLFGAIDAHSTRGHAQAFHLDQIRQGCAMDQALETAGGFRVDCGGTIHGRVEIGT